MRKVLIINGPNLNLLGTRKPEIYGKLCYKELCEAILEYSERLGMKCEIFQSNNEGEIIDKIQNAEKENFKFVIINPGAYTHYSYAIADAIEAINIDVIEVHLTNIYAREDFRKKSVIAPVCVGQISGLGINSYLICLEFIAKSLGVDKGC